MSIEERIVKHLIQVKYGDLPFEVVDKTKKTILDTLGVTLAGSGRPGCSELVRFINEYGGKPESTILLYDTKASAYEAALVNCTMARALDFDDIHRTGMHPSALIVPAALAAAEAYGGVSGKELITAIAIGTDLLCRMRLVPDVCLGMSGWVGEVYGAFGGAAVAGKLWGFNEAEMQNALGLAYSQAAGTMQPFHDGALATRVQEGLAGRAGLFSAMLTRQGISGAKNFLEGTAGFYPVYYRGIKYDVNRLVNGLGKEYENLQVIPKPYPSCGLTHSPIENVINIMQKNQIKEEDIREVILRVNQVAHRNVCTPAENKYRPKDVIDAMFSLPYTVGTAIMRGDVFIDDFSPEMVSDHERLRVVDKVKIILDEDIDKRSFEHAPPVEPGLHVAEIITKSGKHIRQEMLCATGDPRKPMSPASFAEKFRKCAAFSLKPMEKTKVDQLIDSVMNIDKLDDISNIMELLR